MSKLVITGHQIFVIHTDNDGMLADAYADLDSAVYAINELFTCEIIAVRLGTNGSMWQVECRESNKDWEKGDFLGYIQRLDVQKVHGD